MRKIYLVIGGYINAKDGDRHYVKSQKLIQLYGVNPAECVTVEAMNPDTEKYIEKRNKDLIILRPRFDGNYKIKADGRPV